MRNGVVVAILWGLSNHCDAEDVSMLWGRPHHFALGTKKWITYPRGMRANTHERFLASLHLLAAIKNQLPLEALRTNRGVLPTEPRDRL